MTDPADFLIGSALSRRAFVIGGVIGSGGVTLAGSADAMRGPGGDSFAPLPATNEITPFRIAISPAAIADLRRRLATARFPDKETVSDWSQGAPLATVQELVAYWQRRYDMRRLETRLNALPQFRTQIDGLGIHFIHVRSRHPGAKPIILTHGWPGSVVEFLNVIVPLTDPTAHGGRAEDAFHVVIPSLPGYGFSDKPPSAVGACRASRALGAY